MIKSFSKIERYTEGSDLIKPEVTEKLDGSQITWLRTVENGLEVSSKNLMLFEKSKTNNYSKLFAKGVEYLLEIESTIPFNIQFYGEYLEKPKHNTLAYHRIPKNHIALFAARWCSDNWWYKYYELKKHAEQMNIDVVPLYNEKESYLGGVKPEGFVTSTLSDDRLSIKKYKNVSDEFMEVKQQLKDKKKLMKGIKQDDWAEFKERFRTEARWQKAVIHLQEQNLLKNEMSDIGLLYKEVMCDIIQEESEMIQEFFNKTFRKELLKHSCEGIVEFYKRRLENE